MSMSCTNKRHIKYLKTFRTCPRQLIFFKSISRSIVPKNKIHNTHWKTGLNGIHHNWWCLDFWQSPHEWRHTIFKEILEVCYMIFHWSWSIQFFLDNILYTHSMITKKLGSTYSQEKKLGRVFAFLIVFKSSVWFEEKIKDSFFAGILDWKTVHQTCLLLQFQFVLCPQGFQYTVCYEIQKKVQFFQRPHLFSSKEALKVIKWNIFWFFFYQKSSKSQETNVKIRLTFRFWSCTLFPIFRV